MAIDTALAALAITWTIIAWAASHRDSALRVLMRERRLPSWHLATAVIGRRVRRGGRAQRRRMDAVVPVGHWGDTRTSSYPIKDRWAVAARPDLRRSSSVTTAVAYLRERAAQEEHAAVCCQMAPIDAVQAGEVAQHDHAAAVLQAAASDLERRSSRIFADPERLEVHRTVTDPG